MPPRLLRLPQHRIAPSRRPVRLIRPRQMTHAERLTNRLYRLDLPILSIEGVALLLCVSVQTVRGIPQTELPRRSVGGKRLVYLRDDVLAYVSRSHRPRENADELVRAATDKVVKSAPGSGRLPNRRRS